MYQPPPAADVHTLQTAVQDARRLVAVRATGLLDTPPEDTFDRLTRLATQLTGAPVAFLSLVDRERDFYKSHCGFGEPLASSRQLSGRTFCHYSLLSDGPLVLDDVMAHPGYAEVPTVRTLGIRAYLGVPLRDEDGHCLGSFCVVDFSPRRWTPMDIELLSQLAYAVRRELALRSALTQTRAASRAKSAFLANMSHEIRTPMNAILGFSHLLTQSSLSPQQREQVDRIQSAGQQLMSLLDNILDLSKIEAGQLKLEPVEFSLPALVEEVIHRVSDTARTKGLTLLVEWPEPQPAWMQADPSRLRQALFNLVSNAVKFTHQGSVRLSISLEPVGAEVCQLKFAIQDTGIGVAPEPLAQLFQAFTQADESTTRAHGGTGLGLVITRRLAELMGGLCGAHSQPGQGSTFWFTAQVHLVPGPASQVAAPAPEPQDTLDGVRVLLVEDHPINQEIALALLAGAGLAVTVADNGLQALELVDQGFDLILMDVQMPGMDGLQATRQIRLRDSGARVPILAMTANASLEDRLQCLAAGMDDLIAKPVQPDTLLAALRQWVRRDASGASARRPG